MPYLLERHKVRDYARGGRPSTGTPRAERPPDAAGRVFRNTDDPNEVVALFEWEALEGAWRRIGSATLGRKFEEAGSPGDGANRALPPRRGIRADLRAIGR